MKKHILIIMGLFLLTVGCATKYELVLETGRGDYKTSQTFDRSFEEVWTATVTVMQQHPIKVIEKDSGILVTSGIIIGKSVEYKIGWYPWSRTPDDADVIATAHYTLIDASLLPKPGYRPSGFYYCNIMVNNIGDDQTSVTVHIISNIKFVERHQNTVGIRHDIETDTTGYREALILWDIARELGITAEKPELPKFISDNNQ